MEQYENIAWYGGSFSPPTKIHVRIAIEIGKTLLNITKPGSKCCVCIVPVAGKHTKDSVQDDCIPNPQRWKLAESMLEAIRSDSAAENHLRQDELHFRLLDYEFAADGYTSAGEQSAMPFIYPETKIYIAQSQAKIMKIMERTQNGSDELLSKNFIMFPQQGQNIKTIIIDMISALIRDHQEQKSAPLNIEQALATVRNIEFLGEEIEDETYSSEVRKIIQSSKCVRQEDLSDFLHPIVFEALSKMHEENPNIYLHEAIGKKPFSDGTRKKSNVSLRNAKKPKIIF